MHSVTPLFHEPSLGWLKMECWQPAGSFKIRGIGALCRQAASEGAGGFVCSSGGNAGYAASWAAQVLGLPIEVVVPQTTSTRVIRRLEGLGASVAVHGQVWDEADARARSEAAEKALTYVHPFDHPALWEGHASLVDEVATQLTPRPDAVFLSVGGGGLLAGVAEGLARNGMGDVPIVAVETQGAASYAAALAAGRPVALSELTSIATTLSARQVCDAAFEWSQRRPIESVLVTDAEALDACRRFEDLHRTVVEPACGATLAAAARMRRQFANPLVIVCGGIAGYR